MTRTWIAIVGAGLLAGCSVSAFDDRRASAWSDSNGAEPLSADQHAIAVAGVTTDNLGATIAVLGVDPPGIQVIRYDQTGGLTIDGADLPDLSALDILGTATLAAAPDPVSGANGLVALGGLGALDQIRLYDVSAGSPREVGVLSGADCGAPGANLGNAMTFGYTFAGVRNQVDLVALRSTELFIFPDIDLNSETHTCFRCELGTTRAPVDVALIDLRLGDNDGEEIMVSLDGALSVFSAFNVEEANGVGCFDIRTPQISNLTSPGGEPDFGGRLAVGNPDENNEFDVAASSAIGDVVYIIPNLTNSGPGGMLQTLPAPNDSGSFGDGPMAFADVDGDDSDELLVGDPLATPRGVPSAGQVTVYELSDDVEYERRAVLFDSDPETDQLYGRALAIAEFVFGEDDVDLLVVGARDESFTLFRTLDSGVDPRK